MTDEEERAKNAEKSRKRRAEMQAAAERDGFVDTEKSKAASQAITAWKKGEYVLIDIETLKSVQKKNENMRQVLLDNSIYKCRNCEDGYYVSGYICLYCRHDPTAE
jgi:aerobic-type carbon monoxide dehydrogenase small subunit (CoxS/CutS family)